MTTTLEQQEQERQERMFTEGRDAGEEALASDRAAGLWYDPTTIADRATAIATDTGLTELDHLAWVQGYVNAYHEWEA